MSRLRDRLHIRSRPQKYSAWAAIPLETLYDIVYV